MRKKEKPLPRRLKGSKLIATKKVYQKVDDFGEVLREADWPFPLGKETKKEIVLLDLDKLEDALV